MLSKNVGWGFPSFQERWRHKQVLFHHQFTQLNEILTICDPLMISSAELWLIFPIWIWKCRKKHTKSLILLIIKELLSAKICIRVTQPRLIRSAETAETCCKQQNNNLKFFEENIYLVWFGSVGLGSVKILVRSYTTRGWTKLSILYWSRLFGKGPLGHVIEQSPPSRP